MDWMEIMQARHSVRSYTDAPIGAELREQLGKALAACNAESGLHMQLAFDEPAAFSGFMGRHYGSFSGVCNYIGLIGKRGAALDETLGWYGEKLVLLAQSLGLNSCWVALTYSRGKCPFAISRDEALRGVIAIGYGATQGVAHKNKPLEKLAKTEGAVPGWFSRGIEAALLAPTAVNQQQFLFTYAGGAVTAKALPGLFAKMDLGIVKYHFELGAGKEHFRWA